MILANVIFGVRRKNEPDQLENLVESYLGTLYHSGQLCGEYFLTWTQRRLNAHVMLSGRSATALRHHSPYGKKALKKIIEAFGAKPIWRLLDDDASKPMSSWRDAPFLYLFTHALDKASPICRGDGEPPVPVFTLPVTFEQKSDLYSWQWSYYHHDHIWLESRALEIAAYRQLADPGSELAEQGRDLCREIETATKIPTFYYLMRYWGRAKGEDQRRCPGCGGPWKTGHIGESPEPFWQFAFKCDPCRLVSHLGVSTDGGRHTKIGEMAHGHPSPVGKS